jgi:hypothetical protein
MTIGRIQSKVWHAGLLVGVIVAMLAVASPVLDAKAAAPQAPATPSGQQMELFYHRLLLASANQAKRLDFSKENAGKARQWIDTLRSQGKDVAVLDAALSAFNAGIAQAEGSHNAAAGILSSHAGFDDAGKVTDFQAARETIHTAANNLRQAHLTITQATMNFRSVVRDWRAQHKS